MELKLEIKINAVSSMFVVSWKLCWDKTPLMSASLDFKKSAVNMVKESMPGYDSIIPVLGTVNSLTCHLQNWNIPIDDPNYQ